jgi:hydrogenase large subunit
MPKEWQYKGNRDPRPDEYHAVCNQVFDVIRLHRIPILYAEGWEADDVMGAAAARARADGLITVLLTLDKDMGQVVDETTFLWDGRDRLTGPREVEANPNHPVPPRLIPDLLAIASFYKEWAQWGEGVGNFLTYGDFPGRGGMADLSGLMIPRGAILNRNLSEIHEVNLHEDQEVEEFVAHSYYDYSSGKASGRHPYVGETALKYTGPKPPYQQLDVAESYSWVKSPRWKGNVVEVGPLARVLMLYASGHAQTKELVDGTLAKLDVPVTALYSTLGRTAARGLETKIISDAMLGWYGQLIANIRAGDTKTHNEQLWDPSSWPRSARGAGFMEAPRGGLGHWIVIENGKIANYQAIVPSTWNSGPRDARNQPGPYEAALAGTPMHDPKQPLEILRTIHSFDPCLACAVHVVDTDGTDLCQIKVL